MISVRGLLLRNVDQFSQIVSEEKLSNWTSEVSSINGINYL